MQFSNFRRVFGNRPIVRVIDFFLDNQEFDYSLADVIRSENIQYVTVKTVWDELVTRSVLTPTRKSGKATLYRLNTKSALVQQFIKLDLELTPPARKLKKGHQFPKQIT